MTTTNKTNVKGEKKTIQVSKRKKATWMERLRITSFSGRGELRQVNNSLVILCFLLIFVIFWQDCNYRSGYSDIAKNQWLVIKESADGEITMNKTGDFQSQADKITARNLAINIVKLIQQTGTNNIDENENKIKLLLTEEAAVKYSEAAQKQREDLKELKSSRGISIYRKITPEGITVRDMSVKDFPPGAKVSLSGLDVAAYGKVITYDAATNMEITRENFFFWIKMSQLEERTEENIWGLKVAAVNQLNPNESVAAQEQQKADADKKKADEDSRILPKKDNSESNTNTN